MAAEATVALAAELQSLLKKAGLPEERELIGRKFAFTYDTTAPRSTEPGDLVRVSGTIEGIYTYKGMNGFRLLTTTLPKRWVSDTEEPSICILFKYNDGVPSITFRHNNFDGTPNINACELFYGDLELL